MNWAGADGRAISGVNCQGYQSGNKVKHCKDNLDQAKRWQMRVSNVPLTIFRADLGSMNGVAATSYQFRITSLTSKMGTYSALMRDGCRKFGMRPVWCVCIVWLFACHTDCCRGCHTSVTIQATAKTIRKRCTWAKHTISAILHIVSRRNTFQLASAQFVANGLASVVMETRPLPSVPCATFQSTRIVGELHNRRTLASCVHAK